MNFWVRSRSKKLQPAPEPRARDSGVKVLASDGEQVVGIPAAFRSRAWRQVPRYSNPGQVQVASLASKVRMYFFEGFEPLANS